MTSNLQGSESSPHVSVCISLSLSVSRIIPRLRRFVPGAPDGPSVIASLPNSRKKNKIFTCSLFTCCDRNGNAAVALTAFITHIILQSTF